MIIDTFDKELEEIGVQVDLSIESADEHLNQRLGKGEAESVTLSVKSHERLMKGCGECSKSKNNRTTYKEEQLSFNSQNNELKKHGK